MIDPEVARLRQLRNEALLVRELARTFDASAEADDAPACAHVAGASWRIARVVSGRLRSHPYAEYQRDASVWAQLLHRLHARCVALTCRTREQRLGALRGRLTRLARRLDDAIVLAWTSEFSEALGRSRGEVRGLIGALGQPAGQGVVPAVRAARRPLAGGLGAAALDADWPYLAL